MAAKTLSAGVEQLISSSYILKTSDRARMLVGTEHFYLYIYYNIPALVNWDVKRQIYIL